MKHLKTLTVFSKRTLIQMRMKLLCKINNATSKSYENYLIINIIYINKFISFIFKKEELKTHKTMSSKTLAWCKRSLNYVKSFFPSLVNKFLLQ